MTDQDKQKFMELMLVIAELHEKKFSAPVLRMWWNGLKEFDIRAIEAAIEHHTMKSQWKPQIADIRNIIEGSTVDQSSLAWTVVDRAVRQIGTYRDVVFDDPIIHRVVADMGGWIALGTKTDKEWPFVAKEFETRYKAYKMRVGDLEYPPVLIGIANAQNSIAGMPAEPAVLIGNPVKAKEVLAGGSNKPLLTMTLATDVIDMPRRLN